MEPLRKRLRKARQERRWPTAALYSVVIIILFAGLELLRDRWAAWANSQIDKKTPLAKELLVDFLAWEWFPEIAWLILVVLGIAGVIFLYRRTAPASVVEDGPSLSISVTNIRWSLEPPNIIYRVMLTFRAEMRMQLASLNWLWDIPSEGGSATQINHAEAIPVDYLEGVQSHEVKFTVPVYSGHYKTRFRALANGEFWDSDEFGTGHAGYPEPKLNLTEPILGTHNGRPMFDSVLSVNTKFAVASVTVFAGSSSIASLDFSRLQPYVSGERRITDEGIYATIEAASGDYKVRIITENREPVDVKVLLGNEIKISEVFRP